MWNKRCCKLASMVVMAVLSMLFYSCGKESIISEETLYGSWVVDSSYETGPAIYGSYATFMSGDNLRFRYGNSVTVQRNHVTKDGTSVNVDFYYSFGIYDSPETGTRLWMSTSDFTKDEKYQVFEISKTSHSRLHFRKIDEVGQKTNKEVVLKRAG